MKYNTHWLHMSMRAEWFKPKVIYADVEFIPHKMQCLPMHQPHILRNQAHACFYRSFPKLIFGYLRQEAM